MFKQKFYLIVFTIYQLFSTAFICLGIWPDWVIFVNLAVQLGAVIAFDLEYSLYSVILSIPFYLAVPNPKFDSLSAWRLVFAVLLAVLIWRQKIQGKGKIEFFKWDRSLLYFAAAIILSILFEPFKSAGIRKFAFVLNAYFLYIAALNILKTKEQLLRAIKITFTSLAMILAIGYIQFASTFTASIYYFWQYWAETISKAYYGKTLADTLTYSNSWFSFSKGSAPSLRMFSILPDSHAFAVLIMFSMPYALALLYFVKKTWQRITLWAFIVFAALAISLSGTRGIWAGALAPIIVLVYLYARRWGRRLLAPNFIPIILLIVFLAGSPLLQKVFSQIRSGFSFGNFAERATSIYDLNEPSNAGRILIWKNTLKYASGHPLIGAGFGNFVVSLNPDQNSVATPNPANQAPTFQQLAEQKNKTYNLPNRFITAHNLYLDVLAETGLIGLVFFLVYLKDIFTAFWNFFKKHYLYAEDGYVAFVTSMAIALVWLFAYSLVDGTLLNDRVLMFFFLNLAFSANIIKAYHD